MADEIRATPQNRIGGLLSSGLSYLNQGISQPFGYQNPPGAMLVDLLGLPALQRTIERMSYGEPLTTGSGMTTRPRPDTLEAALAVAPLLPQVTNMLKNAKELPVGMSIKSIDGAKLVNIPIKMIEHGEAITPGGTLTFKNAKETIKEYASRETPFPPIDVVSNESGGWMVADGSRRLEAAKLRGDKTIQAYVSPFDKEGLEQIKKLKLEEKEFKPKVAQTSDGYKFYEQPDGTYTDGDVTYESLDELLSTDPQLTVDGKIYSPKSWMQEEAKGTPYNPLYDDPFREDWEPNPLTSPFAHLYKEGYK